MTSKEMWIVMGTDYDGSSIFGVFDELEDAKKCLELTQEVNEFFSNFFMAKIRTNEHYHDGWFVTMWAGMTREQQQDWNKKVKREKKVIDPDEEEHSQSKEKMS